MLPRGVPVRAATVSDITKSMPDCQPGDVVQPILLRSDEDDGALSRRVGAALISCPTVNVRSRTSIIKGAVYRRNGWPDRRCREASILWLIAA